MGYDLSGSRRVSEAILIRKLSREIPWNILLCIPRCSEDARFSNLREIPIPL